MTGPYWTTTICHYHVQSKKGSCGSVKHSFIQLFNPIWQRKNEKTSENLVHLFSICVHPRLKKDVCFPIVFQREILINKETK